MVGLVWGSLEFKFKLNDSVFFFLAIMNKQQSNLRPNMSQAKPAEGQGKGQRTRQLSCPLGHR